MSLPQLVVERDVVGWADEQPSFVADILDVLFEGVYVIDGGHRIAYWNRAAERITGYTASEVMGSHCSDQLVYPSETACALCEKTGCAALVSIRSRKPTEGDVVIRTKDGHCIEVLTRGVPILNRHGEIVGALEVFTDNLSAAKTRETIQTLQKQASLDPLTEIGNRRYGHRCLEASLMELKRDPASRFGVIFVDIDHFKLINDQHGHDLGDRVIKLVARTIANTVRPFDTVARWGGEEFLVIAKHVVLGQLETMAERVRAFVSASPICSTESSKTVTVSMGATAARHDDTVEGLLARADRLMYQSKARGRNCVSVG